LPKLAEVIVQVRNELGLLVEAKRDLDSLLAREKHELTHLTETRNAARALLKEPSGEEILAFFEDSVEQKEINSIENTRRQFERKIIHHRTNLMSPLDRLRQSKTEAAFHALDGLLLEPGNTDRFISLVQGILDLSVSGRRRKTGIEGDVESVKVMIRTMLRESLSHADICERLGDMPRPARATWRTLSWPKAFKNEKYRDAVKTYISKVASS
jgi:hypothetical protein